MCVTVKGTRKGWGGKEACYYRVGKGGVKSTRSKILPYCSSNLELGSALLDAADRTTLLIVVQ